MRRYTFVVRVHPGGTSTLENLGTRERVQVLDLDAVGPQIERWVEMFTAEARPGQAGPRSAAAPSPD